MTLLITGTAKTILTFYAHHLGCVAVQSKSMSVSSGVSVYAPLPVESSVYRVNNAKRIVKTVSIPSFADVDESINIGINVEEAIVVITACHGHSEPGLIIAWHRFN
jgi:hypothetical protein